MTIRTTHTYEYQYSLLFGDAGYLLVMQAIYGYSYIYFLSVKINTIYN
ncbi:hypothetical protein SPAR73_0365 [Streptococcus pneumoniae GA41565]|nr:hypothetical protein SPAR50_0374 [Streptococcus pneumoniae GA17570]EHE24256.1 hypothetical protein SPAR73_0365 [Streptococcus pneumoniae GA41565]MDG7210964.1 hypothetical protein [Streptococcus pneumoniae]